MFMPWAVQVIQKTEKLQTKKTNAQPQYGLTANLALQGKRRICTGEGKSATAQGSWDNAF